MIAFYIIGTIAAIVLYSIISVIVHALFERRSLLKHGASISERIANSNGWHKASCDEAFAEVAAGLWPMIPFLYILKFVWWLSVKIFGYPVGFFVSKLKKLHGSVVHARLESTGAKSIDSEKGAYRSK